MSGRIFFKRENDTNHFWHEDLGQTPAAGAVLVTRERFAEVLALEEAGTHTIGALPSGQPVAVPVPTPDAGQLLLDAYRVKVDAINAACEAAITAGFWSAALGAPHRYSSQLDDQLNLTGVIVRGLPSPYACRDADGVKDYRLHTFEQLRQVGDDFTLFKLQLLQQANTLKGLIEQARADGDAQALAAVAWEAVQP